MLLHSVIFCAIFLFHESNSQLFSNYQVYYQWKQIDYNFPNDSIRREYIQSGKFIQKNVLPSGFKIFRDKLYIGTPRYLPGVPYSLNVIPYKKSQLEVIFGRKTGPKLTPFPSYEMQEEGNCTAFQLVQAMELDPYGRLWVVDAGRTEALSDTGPKNLCPAKLVIIDLLKNNQIERSYEFPDSVATYEGNAIKDLEIACTSSQDCFSYISNANGTYSIVVYDYKNDDSWYATHPTMRPDPEKSTVTIEGDTVQIPFGINGIGLTPKSTNYSTIYFSNLAGDRVYSIPTNALKNGSVLKANPVLSDSYVTNLGPRSTGQADGTAMDNNGRWFYGSLPESAVYSIDTTGNPRRMPKVTRNVRSTTDMQWPDTFAFDNKGYLAFLSTRFQLLQNKKLSASEVNFRIIRFKTNSTGYNL